MKLYRRFYLYEDVAFEMINMKQLKSNFKHYDLGKKTSCKLL